MNNTSLDTFFHNRITVEQPKKGYRAGIDAVLLAIAAAKIPFSSICELGSGVGTSLIGTLNLCGAENKPALAIEIDEDAAKILERNLELNGFNHTQILNVNGLESAKINAFYNKFDLVISNPPFFDDDSKINLPANEKLQAYIIGAPLKAWIKAMLNLCDKKGEIVMIHRAERLSDILEALKGRAGDVRIYPIRPRENQAASRILVRARKYSRAPILLLKGIDLHPLSGATHYTTAAEKIFNGGHNEFSWGE